ncbi:MAG: T9SS type A sorting domain-containing protein, partial [Bacteroidetes bacterium]
RNDFAFTFPQSNAQFLVAVDIDGDGDMDVVTNDMTNNYLHIMKNNGSGSFTSTDKEFTTKFGALSAGDLDKDGDMDILAACATVDSVEQMNNDGAGNLSMATRYYWTSTDGPTATLIADINSTFGDKQDLVWLNGLSDRLTYFKDGSGIPLFTADNVSVGGYPTQVSAVDIDTDSDLDLVVANYNDQTFSVLTNSGSGTGTFSQTTHNVPDNPDDLSTADIDGDGDMDIVTINNDATVSVFKNYNGGHVASITPANGALDQSASANIVVVFDENIDQATLTSSTVKLVGSISGVHSWALSSYDAGTYTATINPSVDFVPGEMVSVVVSKSVQSSVGVALERGYASQFVTAAGNGASFAAKTDYAAGTTPKNIILTDLNADGDPDLVAVNSGSDNVSVRLNNGDGTYAAEVLLSTGSNPSSVAAGDVDGDGDIDLVVTVTSADQLAKFTNLGSGTFSSATTYSTAPGPNNVKLSDIDADGDVDVVYSTSIQVYMQLNNGSGVFSAEDNASAGTSPVGVVVLDMDNDGDRDFISVNNGSNNVRVAYNNGTNWYASGNNYSVGTAPTALVSGDFDNDGYVDVVTANLAGGNGTISYLENNHSGGFNAKVDYSVGTGSQPRGLAAADIDGDGDLDVMVADGANDAVKLFINDGNGIFSNGGEYATGDNPYAIATADVNGDGLMDVAAANYGGGSVSVKLNVLSAPSVTTSAATSVTSTGATLNGVVNALNLGTVTRFAYKLNSAGSYAAGDTVTATPTGFAGGAATSISAALTGLQQNTMYDFKAIGVNSVGASEGSALSFTTSEDALVISSISPTANGLDVDTAANITVTFNVPVRSDSLNASNVKVYGSISGPIAGSISYDGPSKTMTFNPTGYFRAGEVVSITLKNSIASSSALSFLTPKTSSFTVAATGTGPGFFSATTVSSHFSKSESRFLSADVDNDGDPDLVGWYYNQGFTVSKNNGAGFDAPVSNALVTDLSNSEAVRYGDIDGDGYGDIIAARSNSSTYIVILKNNGSGTFSLYDSINTGSSAVYYGHEVKDFNNDGKLDIAYYANGASQFTIAYNSTGWTNTDSYPVTAGQYRMTSGDVDNDGDVDILFAAAGNLRILKNNGNEVFASAVSYAFNASDVQEIIAQDFNGDGYLDVMASGGNNNDGFVVILNNGDGTFGSGTTYTLSILPAVGRAGDLDGDGDIDLAFVFQNVTGMNVAYNNGSGVFNQQAMFNVRMPGMTIMDYDVDGDLDIIGKDYLSNVDLKILENTTPSAPTTSASGVNITNDYGTQLKVNWTNGSGTGRIVVMKQGSAVTWTPSDNTTYTANASFGSGTDLGDGSYVVYNGVSTNVPVTGLTVNTTYHVAVFEYNGLSGIEKYKTSAPGTTSDQTNSVSGYPFDTTSGHAFQYDGNGYSSSNSSFAIPNAFTYEVWVKPASIGSQMVVLDHGEDYLWIALDATGKFFGRVYDNNAASDIDITGTTTAVAGQWYHVVLTGAEGSPAKLYVNGVLEATSSGNIGALMTGMQWFYPATDYFENYYYSGDIDEIRIWGDVRTQSEIRENMFKTLSGIPADLLHYWQFNEGSGSTVVDLVNENSLSLGDAAWVASGAPVGSANISTGSVAASNNGPHTFGDVTLTMTDGFDNPVDVVVSELTADPSNYPAGFGSSVGGKYFVINLFGDPGTFSTSLTLTFGAGAITMAQQNEPSLLSLYKRESNSSGAWTLVATATAADSVTGQVTWAGITSFSQFLAVSEDNEVPPTLTITKEDGADWTLAENQDRISDDIWLTREDYGVLFNIKTESSPNSDSSPAGTEWALGKISDGIETLTFDAFRNLRDGDGMDGSLSNLPGKDVVLHLIAEDIYFDVHFNSWSSGGDGGFSYTRSLKPLELIQNGYSNLTPTSVTVSGQIHSKTTTATAYVIYGTVSGTYTDSVLITPGTIPADTVYTLSKTLTGLSDGTTYYYRFAASNGSLYARSSERSVRPHTVQYWNKDNGTITFTKDDYDDWNLAENQDRINNDVWLTRKDNEGLFNIRSESGYDGDQDTSPAGTEWAVGSINDGVENLTFDTWYNTQQALGGGGGPEPAKKGDVQTTSAAGPPDMVGLDMVMHLIDEDIYIDVKFLSWTQSDEGGGFSYQRASAPLMGSATHATNVGAATATVHGSVYSTGYNATAKFFYGTSSGVYTDSIAATPSSITMNTATSVSADLTGLSPGVLYYVKLKSQNDTMSHRSGDMTVMTMSGTQANSLRFDGSDDHVRIEDANAFDLTNTYTLEAWIKPSGFSSMAGIISKYHSNGSNGYFIRLSNNHPYTGIRFDEQETASGILTAGNWYHIAAVNNNGTRTLYVNGSPVSIDGEPFTTSSNSDHIAIGSDFGGRFFNGDIDEVRIWNVARTQQQIQDNMNLPFTSAQSGLVGYWQLNAGTGTVAHGHGTAGGDGRLMNFNFTGSSGWVNSEAPLSVELTSFTATAKRFNAELAWGTATETDNYGFEVERRLAGTVNAGVAPAEAWSKVGFVEGNGTTNAPKEYSYTDRNLKAGKYVYRLKQVDRSGKFGYSAEVEVNVGVVPLVFTLEQNYPNPFNPSTTIGFTLEKSGMTTLKVYDIVGREVATLVNGTLDAGVYHQARFDASRFASGIYFARLQSGGKTMLKKMMLVK